MIDNVTVLFFYSFYLFAVVALLAVGHNVMFDVLYIPFSFYNDCRSRRLRLTCNLISSSCDFLRNNMYVEIRNAISNEVMLRCQTFINDKKKQKIIVIPKWVGSFSLNAMCLPLMSTKLWAKCSRKSVDCTFTDVLIAFFLCPFISFIFVIRLFAIYWTLF
jgi:hypothetical protein